MNLVWTSTKFAYRSVFHKQAIRAKYRISPCKQLTSTFVLSLSNSIIQWVTCERPSAICTLVYVVNGCWSRVVHNAKHYSTILFTELVRIECLTNQVCLSSTSLKPQQISTFFCGNSWQGQKENTSKLVSGLLPRKNQGRQVGRKTFFSG